MLFFQDSKIENLAVHQVGNKLRGEFYVLYEPFMQKLDGFDELRYCLMQFFVHPFKKVETVFRLFHANGDLKLNEVYYYTSKFFDGIMDIQELSTVLTKLLYEVSYHPKIRAANFYVVHFKDVQFEGEVYDAIGLFKSVNKDTFLEVNAEGSGIALVVTRDAISIDNIEVGALILKSEKEFGYKVLVSDCKSKDESQVWKDDFLQVKVRNDNYQQTSNLIKLAKQFIVDKMDDTFELDKVDKIDMLNKTAQYFKEHETYDQEEFMEIVFGGNVNAVALFTDYKNAFTEEYNIPMDSSFDISDKAVKKTQTSLKSVIKLDKNAHIYLHGKRDILEKGFDEDKGMNFYKVYFENES
jgi:hypothetical protein